jgi:hypothetical protein
LVAQLQPWLTYGWAAVIDSTVLRAGGGVWYKKDREAGLVPQPSIDTEAAWTKSGLHGWVYGWKLHLVCTAAAVWVRLAAELSAANAADIEHAPALIRHLPDELRFLLGDQHYRDADLESLRAQQDYLLVTTRAGKGHPHPHTDPGVEVRHVFNKTRSLAIDNINEQFKVIFDAHGAVPTRGRVPTQRFALGAVSRSVSQLTLLYRHQIGADLRRRLECFSPGRLIHDQGSLNYRYRRGCGIHREQNSLVHAVPAIAARSYDLVTRDDSEVSCQS